MDENILGYETIDEASSLLQNGILVETGKGLVCMSLNDAISSGLNLSVEDLKKVANELISQQNVGTKDKVCVKSSINLDSDGFSSECSDVSFTSTPSTSSSYITFTSLSNSELTTTSVTKDTKIVTFLPVKSLPPDFKQEPKTVGSEVVPNPPITTIDVHKPPKRRGGWPKGRKRKPELKNLPPKAPATGYNLYLNDQRKLFKDSKLAFHEITKVIGNKWSNLSLEEKRPYLAKAEEDKRRYREELKQYRQSDAYRAYLAKKRRNRLQNNVLSESDMDATDEIDEEDNEELYCRTCDQWFHNLHNKREHLQGRQHTQSVAGDIKRELDLSASDSGIFSTSLDESSLDAMPNISKHEDKSSSVSDAVVNLVAAVARREREIKSLQRKLQETIMAQSAFCQQLNALRQRHCKLKNDLSSLKEHERNMEAKVAQLWQVPSWFIITDFNTDFNDENK
ncbi:uncharacterized protein LOC659902 [Tribolium castaneum]|uniref:HMG box domain-containing protein n=1 Tax=Tribolium castaneum TaxID=7070 RepID=D6X431_TRICA|nr:PREDICTED: uncharacterized protein LOC659902 [Tribolium castaneum]XP_008198693.1 PREDICTED: uncharacterized protein LOC659902 [Tribolium castaneum]XP_015839468.1 PREDICTED: uncharacterized protein LOC659902 [Tribolium castaneum]EEZ97332.1 hypothetical protein TcasGA2_TC011144 [Tribolium castaneum]|eukprot:XP_008198692.1 PREDICTED: uncharacterized protein LOC659902 [Tribolium castaneum]